MLPGIIGPEQSKFMEGRQILDGIITAHEAIHSLKTSNRFGMLIKLVMSKAFDKISWKILRAMLGAFGFSTSWVNWVLALVSYAFLSILTNRSPFATFSTSRGILQGDPLSPYLFIILVEGLRKFIKAQVQEIHMQGISLNSFGTPHSHL